MLIFSKCGHFLIRKRPFPVCFFFLAANRDLTLLQRIASSVQNLEFKISFITLLLFWDSLNFSEKHGYPRGNLKESWNFFLHFYKTSIKKTDNFFFVAFKIEIIYRHVCGILNKWSDWIRQICPEAIMKRRQSVWTYNYSTMSQ